MGKEQDLLQAVKDQDVGSVEKLLVKHHGSKKIVGSTKRLNINQQDADGMSVLHHAALLGSVEILKQLLDHGALVDVKDVKGLRPLHYAAWQGHTKPTEALLCQGSSVDKPAVDGNTPLHLACEHGHFDVVKRLLECGSDVCLANAQHKMPLDLACEFGRTSVVERLLESEPCRAALRDTSKDTVDNNRTTCLHLAARNGHIDTIRLLLEAGIDINRSTLQGTCLHEAAKYGKTDVVRLLLSCGIDVSLLNSYEQTALELVNKFTMTRAARQLKEMLKEASLENGVQPVCDHISRPDCQNPNLFKEGNFSNEEESGSTTAGMWKSHRNGLDCRLAGHAVFLPPNSTALKKKLGRSSPWDRSSPQPSPLEAPHFVGGNSGFNGGRVPSPKSSLGKIKAPDLGANSDLANRIAHRSVAGVQTGISGDCQSPTLLSSLQSLRNGGHLSIPDDGHSKDGSNRMSGESSGNGSYHSVGSQQSDNNCQNRLSGQSYESGVSGVSSSSRQSSGSSQGSLDHLEESGYSSTVNVHELLQQGLSDTDILCTWLSSLHLEELTNLFVDAGYDMPTITRMTPEDLTAIGITKPSTRKKLKSEISKLTIGDGIPDFRPKDLFEWLTSLNLGEYRETLAKQGFGTLDTVTGITWEDLEEIGIKKLGHQKKMMLAIDRLKRINTILHRLSGSSLSSIEGPNQHDSSVSGGKLLSRVSSSMSSASSSSPSFVSASSQRHAAACESVASWKTSVQEKSGDRKERFVLERYGSKNQSASAEIHPMPLNKLSKNFPLSNMTSIDRNTYPALLEESSSKTDPVEQMHMGVSADSVGNGRGLDGDATPTNERKLLGSADGQRVSRTNCSLEEPVDFYKADPQNAMPLLLSSYSTLPKNVCGKRKTADLNGSCDVGFSGFSNFQNVLSSKRANCNNPVQNLSAEKKQDQNPGLSGQKKEPPPLPKRSDSFKTGVLAASIGNQDRLRAQRQNTSVSAQVFSNLSSQLPGNLGSVFVHNHSDVKGNAVAKGSPLFDSTMFATGLLCSKDTNAVELSCDAKHKQQMSNKTADERKSLQNDNLLDRRLSESSEDSCSGLESRHSASSISLESNGSGGAVESNTLPFANENVGTIKQRNPSAKPSILTSASGDGNKLDKSLFEKDATSVKQKSHTNTENVENANTQNLHFTLVNGEIIKEAKINNGNLPYGVNPNDVFNDIDGMLSGLTQELDEMLKFHG